MTTERDQFLKRIRQAVADGNRAGGAPPLPFRGAVGYQGAGADPVARFRDEFAAAGGFAHVVADASAAAEVVLGLLRERSARRVLLGRGAVIDSLDLSGRLAAVGIEIIDVSSRPPAAARPTSPPRRASPASITSSPRPAASSSSRGPTSRGRSACCRRSTSPSPTAGN